MKCMGCGKNALQFLDLGNIPIANAYAYKPNSQGKRYPLSLAYCPSCKLIQIEKPIDPVVLYYNYHYLSSTSSTMMAHAKGMADNLIDKFNLNRSTSVIEIASNDGYLLRNFINRGIPCTGIEPAENIAKIANQSGINTIVDFFCYANAKNWKLTADLIIGVNVLAHVPNINDFMKGIELSLKPNGIAVFEFPYAVSMIKQNEFDTIYHEHVYYYTITAIKNLAEKAGLSLYDVERYDIHGGSVRIFIQKKKGMYKRSSALANVLAKERKQFTFRTVENFAKAVKAKIAKIGDFLAYHSPVVGYGACAKSTNILALCGKDAAVKYIVEDNDLKIGKYVPGTDIPIVAKLQADRCDCIIFPWNIAPEIVKKNTQYKGRFVRLIPEIEEVHG